MATKIKIYTNSACIIYLGLLYIKGKQQRNLYDKFRKYIYSTAPHRALAHHFKTIRNRNGQDYRNSINASITFVASNGNNAMVSN